MQYKIFLSALLTVAAALPLQAQQANTAARVHKIKVTNLDTDSAPTYIVNMPAKQASAPAVTPPAQAAATAPAQAAPAAVAAPAAPAPHPSALLASKLEDNTTAELKKSLYLPVPLAGEKAYFGEKNEFVNDYVKRYLELHNKTLGSVQSNSPKPFQVIDDVLEKKQLPKELKYLAVIESALNHNAVSHAGAVGPWQLMSTTARMMGLSVSKKHDDRRDWYKSTAAATKYLELLYSQLNDWLLVIAAYNSGPTPVQKAIERTGSHNFWDIKPYLPRETQGHVLAFIATASIFENLSKFIELGSVPVDFKFGKDEEPLPSLKKDVPGKPATPPVGVAATAGPATNAVTVPASTITPGSTGAAVVKKQQPYTDEELKQMSIVRIKEPVSLEYTAQELGIDKKLLIRWNPDYDMFIMKTYPTPFYNLRLPKDKFDAFIAKKDVLTKKSKKIFEQTAVK